MSGAAGEPDPPVPAPPYGPHLPPYAPYPPQHGPPSNHPAPPPPYAAPQSLPSAHPGLPPPGFPPAARPRWRPSPGLVALIAAICALGLAVDVALVGTWLSRREPGRPAPSTAPAAVPAPSTAPTPPPAPESATGGPAQITSSDVDALLAEHSAALRARDERRFLAAYDPRNRALVASQRRLYRNLVQVPFTVASYRTAEPVGQAQGSAERPASIDVKVLFVHQVTNVDAHPVQQWYRWRVTRARPGAPLVVTFVGGVPRAGAQFVLYPAPWDLVALTVVRTPHTVLLAHAGTANVARRAAPAAEAAARADLKLWGSRGPASRAFLVVFENDRRRFFSYWSGRSLAKGWVAGYARALPAHERRSSTVGGSRIVVDTRSDYFGAGGDPASLFRHEMAHTLAALEYGDAPFADVPLWVVEGFAMYAETKGLPTRAITGTRDVASYVRRDFSGRLPDNGMLTSTRTSTARAGYALSLLSFRFVAERYGEAACLRLVTSAYRSPGATGTAAGIRSATGLSRQAFESQWAAYVRART